MFVVYTWKDVFIVAITIIPAYGSYICLYCEKM